MITLKLRWPCLMGNALLLIATTTCSAEAISPDARPAIPEAENPSVARLVDTQATPQTKALFINLRRQMGHGILFGHHHTTLHGLGWHQINGPTAPLGTSDVKKLTGSLPSVYGWDLIGCHDPRQPASQQRHAEAVMKKLIIEAFERGGVNTISWHMHNPVTGRPYNDCTKDTVSRILPGGDRHDELTKQLDWAAEFLRELKTSQGISVPIIFRPFHEHTHDGFWWNIPNSSREQYLQLWRFTVTYLRDTRKVHNLLWATAPSGRAIEATADSYLEAYPGDDYVDVLGLDNYFGMPKSPEEAIRGSKRILEKVAIVVRLAQAKNKVAAFTETGHGSGLAECQLEDWYDAHFWQLLKKEPTASHAAYFMVWRNLDEKRYWVPIPGSNQAKGFLNMFKASGCVFSDRLPDMYLEKQPSHGTGK